MSKNIKLMVAMGAAVVAGSGATATVFANLVTQKRFGYLRLNVRVRTWRIRF